MMIKNESRIRVIVGQASNAQAGDAVLTDHDFVPPAGVTRISTVNPTRTTGHGIACPCCLRSDWARALASGFVDRVRSGRPQFTRLIVDLGDRSRSEVIEAILTDGFVSGRYVVDNTM